MRRTCVKCEIEKPVERFEPGGRPGSIRNTCKLCRSRASSRRMRERRAADPELDEKMRAYHRAYTSRPEYRAARRGESKKRTKEQIIRSKAAVHVNNEIKAGRMRKAQEFDCEMGPDGCRGRHEWHHDSYRRDRWMDVRALCVKHHKEWHMNNTPEPSE